MFGQGPNRTIYRSTDGVNWEAVSTASASAMFALMDDTLVRAETALNAEGYRVLAFFRSTDDGQTWQPAHWADTGAEFAWLTPEARIGPYGFHQAANGTIVAVEYRAPVGGRYIYRSVDDGASWSVVYDAGYLQISHFHGVTKHEGLGRWIAAAGDGARQKLLASDDDGLTWYEYTAAGEFHAQPIDFLDFGDPTRLLFGSDLAWQVGLLDVSDAADAPQAVPVITNWDQRPSKGYSFLLFRHMGLFYACSYDLSRDTVKNPVISVSPDLQHWAVYHRFADGEHGALKYVGPTSDFLHMTVYANGNRHLAISPAEVLLRRGVLVTPATVNLFSSLETSSAESTSGWINASPPEPAVGAQGGTLAYTTTRRHSGRGCISYRREDGGSMVLLSPSVPFQTGQTYHARAWVRGRGRALRVRWARNGNAAGAMTHVELSDRWREVVFAPYTVPEGTTDLRLRFELASDARNRCNVYIDTLQVEEGRRSPWQSGDLPRAGTVLVAQEQVGQRWTNLFTLEPESLSDFLTEMGNLLIKSYRFTDFDRLELYYNADEARFELRPVIDGLPRSPVVSPIQHFQRRAQIRIAVRYAPQALSLTVANGRPPETSTVGLWSGTFSGLVTMRYGADNETNVLAATIFGERLYEEYLDDAVLLAEMNRLEPATCLGDLDGSGVVDLSDLAVLIRDFGIGPGGDLDQDGDTDLDDLTRLFTVFGTLCP